MPELPEVEVVRRGLAAHVIGARVGAVEVLHPRAVRRQAGGAPELAALLTGRTITGTGRRGKFLWLATDDPDLVLAAHLGMSGQFRVLDRAGPPPAPAVPVDLGGEAAAMSAAPDAHPHARVRFDLGPRQLWFLDQRTFGWVAAAPLVVDPRGVPVPGMVRGIGPDPTEPAFDAAAAARAMRAHRVEVKRLLLDQSIVSGIGNIYADEALWRACVHPRRRADRLPVRTLVAVLDAASAVMAEALAEGGTSFDSLYVNVNGESGYFGRGLQAYGRAGLPCARCGTPIVRERFMNRSSHACPTCQRPPRARH
ncbi:MAG: bifunctional DNA-formamidopyrimidine glycosylase/DNA-(apurinic or apyrimidinic site) lyase [Candidatus Nanopelagicales bacterium]|jgi:formamidopyrimidine-DNA glycosylase|nr:bifunctional DNA-formamidopyrimidine glycosylase/DNA-(apurinic or apyrimidinic site) lyase [Candidatus Nanopelagicales bacterium]